MVFELSQKSYKFNFQNSTWIEQLLINLSIFLISKYGVF